MLLTVATRMPARKRKLSPPAKMKEYRARLRAQGLRPVQIWVPDPNAPGFRRELRRQVARLDAASEAEALAFIGVVADGSKR